MIVDYLHFTNHKQQLTSRLNNANDDTAHWSPCTAPDNLHRISIMVTTIAYILQQIENQISQENQNELKGHLLLDAHRCNA